MNAHFCKIASLILFTLLIAFPASGQNNSGGLELKLQLISSNTWGVYARPKTDIISSTITGSGQVTVVMPNGYDWSGLVPVSGLWQNNVGYYGPSENPNAQYILFGLVLAEPNYPIFYKKGEETLLFTFQGNGSCPDFMYLIDCGTTNGNDPFCPPNSANSNPINDLSVIEFNGFLDYHFFENIYAPSAWDCHDNDGDSYANSNEDRNGSGDFDQDDLSDLNDFKSLPLEDGIMLKLQLIEENKWGVFAKPHNVTIDSATITGAGQVTVVMPNGYDWSGLVPVNGLWQNGANVVSPAENPNVQYVSFGLMLAEPNYPIVYHNNEETLLFTFEGNANCPDSLYLIDCGTPFQTDPFCPPNSHNSNPGNDLSVIEFNTFPVFHSYVGNYAPSAWSCHDNDGDGIANALEDTNGNGMFDVGIDASDLNTASCNLSISEQPSDVVNCVEAEALFISKVTNPSDPAGLITQYKWQIQMPNSTIWENLTNGIGFQGANNDTLFLTQLNGLHGAKVRLLAWTGLCDTIISETANIHVEGPIVFSSQPEKVVTCAGEGASFHASAAILNAGTLYYQWQVSNDDVNWDNILTSTDGGIYSGFETTSLTVSNSAGFFNKSFRMAVYSDHCGREYSDPAKLVLQGPFEIYDQPDEVSVCKGDQFSLAVDVNNESLDFIDETYLHYQWEESADGGLTWYELSNGFLSNGGDGANGTNSDTLTIIEDISSRYGHLFRVKVWSEFCDPIYSDAAEVMAYIDYAITSSPEDVDLCSGEPAVFSIEMEDNTLGISNPDNLHVQWQESADNGATYFDLQDANSGVEGALTTSLHISEVTGRVGHRFRAKVWADGCDSVYSDYGVLLHTSNNGLVINEQPKSLQLCWDDVAIFTVNATDLNDLTGENLNYQWLIKPYNSYWQAITPSWCLTDLSCSYSGITNDTLMISNIAYMDGVYFKVVVWTDDCNFVYSDSVLLSVFSSVQFTFQPEDVLFCAGQSIEFESETYVGSLSQGDYSYQWEANDGTNGWLEVPTGNEPIGVTYNNHHSNKLQINQVDAAMSEWNFRLKALNPNCSPSYSEEAQLTLHDEMAILQQPQSASICPGNPHIFNALISSPNNSLNYQWQSSVNGTFWSDISEGQHTAMGGQFTGVKTENLHINLVDGLDGQQFRLRTSSDQCSATTDAATLTLDNDPTCEPSVSYVTLGLRLMANRTTWAVYLKPKDGFVPSGNNNLTGAEVTIAASQGFSYKNLQSHAGGAWKPTYVLPDSPDQPDLSFFTFELTPNNSSLNLTEDGVVLFTFAKNGDCPDVIMLMENDVPFGLHPNYVTGTDDGVTAGEPFYFGGLHYYNNKPCKEPVSWETPNNSGDDSLQNTFVQYVQQGNNGTSGADIDFANGKTTAEKSFYCYPNPASETVNIRTNLPFSEGATLRLVNLQGQTLQTHSLENTSELNLSQLTSGMYFILLEINDVVLQREKLVKK